MSFLERDQYLKSVASFLTAQYGFDEKTAYDMIRRAGLKKQYVHDADALLTITPKQQAKVLMINHSASSRSK